MGLALWRRTMISLRPSLLTPVHKEGKAPSKGCSRLMHHPLPSTDQAEENSLYAAVTASSACIISNVPKREG